MGRTISMSSTEDEKFDRPIVTNSFIPRSLLRRTMKLISQVQHWKKVSKHGGEYFCSFALLLHYFQLNALILSTGLFQDDAKKISQEGQLARYGMLVVGGNIPKPSNDEKIIHDENQEVNDGANVNDSSKIDSFWPEVCECGAKMMPDVITLSTFPSF